jgi:hypothetical protein
MSNHRRSQSSCTTFGPCPFLSRQVKDRLLPLEVDGPPPIGPIPETGRTPLSIPRQAR